MKRITATLKMELLALAVWAESIHRNSQRDSELTNQSTLVVENYNLLNKYRNKEEHQENTPVL